VDANTVTILPASAVPADALREAFNASFADYLLKFPPFDGAAWQTFLQRQGVDLAMSRAALRGPIVTAFLLTTPRTHRRTRVSVMGALPLERGSGVAAHLLDEAAAAARARGERWLELEVITTNLRAVALYRGRGFDPVCELHGWRAAPGQGRARAGDVTAVARDAAAQWLAAFDDALPWQASGAAVQAAPGDLQAWRRHEAQLVFTIGADNAASVLSLADRDPAHTAATELLSVLRHRFAAHALAAPQWQRSDAASRAFETAGWARQPLMQWLMRRMLTEESAGGVRF
jgi:ribosomal protein S18 acetylase RimI-like enzyme